MRICKEILKISTFVGIFCMFCPLCTCILQFYVSLNCYMPKCVSYFPFSCGTLQKSKNWFDVLNFGFSHIHGYSGLKNWSKMSTFKNQNETFWVIFIQQEIKGRQSSDLLNKVYWYGLNYDKGSVKSNEHFTTMSEISGKISGTDMFLSKFFLVCGNDIKFSMTSFLSQNALLLQDYQTFSHLISDTLSAS